MFSVFATMIVGTKRQIFPSMKKFKSVNQIAKEKNAQNMCVGIIIEYFLINHNYTFSRKKRL